MNTSSTSKKPLPLKSIVGLVIIPAASIIAMCGLLILGQKFPDEDVLTQEQPLNKTSWQAGEEQ